MSNTWKREARQPQSWLTLQSPGQRITLLLWSHTCPYSQRISSERVTGCRTHRSSGWHCHIQLTCERELPKQIRQLSRTANNKNSSHREAWDFSAFPKGGILLCWGLILAEGESGEKVIEVWKLTNGCFVQKRNNLCYTSGMCQVALD